MPRNVVVLLSTEDGRDLVKRICTEAGIRVSTFEQLVTAELDQQGKQRKAGLWEDFDQILDEAVADTESD